MHNLDWNVQHINQLWYVIYNIFWHYGSTTYSFFPLENADDIGIFQKIILKFLSEKQIPSANSVTRILSLTRENNSGQMSWLCFPKIEVWCIIYTVFELFLGTMADDTNLQPVIGGATSNFLQKSTTLLLPLILLAQLF